MWYEIRFAFLLVLAITLAGPIHSGGSDALKIAGGGTPVLDDVTWCDGYLVLINKCASREPESHPTSYCKNNGGGRINQTWFGTSTYLELEELDCQKIIELTDEGEEPGMPLETVGAGGSPGYVRCTGPRFETYSTDCRHDKPGWDSISDNRP